MIHKISVIFGRAECGATGIRMTRSWDKTTCPDCVAKKKKYKRLTPHDSEYVGSLQEKLDYDCEQDRIYEAEQKELSDDE